MRLASSDRTPWTRLTRLRCRAHLRGRDLAELLHCTPQYIGQLEQGSRRASDELTFAIARLFNEDAADLCASRPTVPPRGSVRREPVTDVA